MMGKKKEEKNNRDELQGRNLDLRLIRRLIRWDLRDPRCYSNAVVYDVTFLARGNLFQNVHFALQDELKKVELTINKLKVLQYPNIRHRAIFRYCQYDKTHPKHFEPTFNCDRANCDSCEAMRMARNWINTCYDMQHRVCTREEAIALIADGARLFQFIAAKQLYSVLFMRRRAINQRGTPVRAAAQWCMLEEVRLYVDAHFNDDSRIERRVLRDSINQLIDGYEVINSDFALRSITPLMPLNGMWRQQRQHVNSCGLLLELHTVGCTDEMLPFTRVWWPLTGSHVGRTLNVVLGINRINHVRLSDPRLALALHSPYTYLTPENTEKRTLGNHLF